MATDTQTAERLRTEFKQVQDALGQTTVSECDDPLGQDGNVQVVLRSSRAAGGGEFILLKTGDSGDKRWTRFRAWGAAGSEHIEKSSYLLSTSGATEFHKRSLAPGDDVSVLDSPDGEDQAWISSLA